MNIPNLQVEFEDIRVLGLALVALLLVLLLMFRGRRRLLVAGIRFLCLAVLLLALANPGKETTSSKSEVSALVDISRSVSEQALDSFARSIAKMTNNDTELEVFAFGKKASRQAKRFQGQASADEIRSFLGGERDALDSGETNLEAALRATQAKAQSASLLLLTDGFETAGNAREVAPTIRDSGMKIFPLLANEDIFLEKGVSISSLYAPVTSGEGDAVEVRATLRNSQPQPRSGKLEIFLEQERILSQNVKIDGDQEKVFVARTSPLKGGLKRVRTVFTSDRGAATSSAERHRWISVKEKSKILLLMGSKDDGRVLRELLRDRGYATQEVVADGSQEVPTSFEGISSVVFANVSQPQLPKKFLPALSEFVKAGGGLVLVGGERSFGLGNYIDTPLEEISPVKFVPPQTEKRRLTNAFVLVIDKSQSMSYEGKMESAKQAAIASIQSLKDEDYIGVIGFDSIPFVIIDVKQVKDAREDAARRLENLTASGKTELLGALTTARQRLQKAPGSRKHLIVLSDGKIPWSPEEYTQEINSLRKDGISISTVAVGMEADVPFMKTLSRYGSGAFYQTLDARDLPKIFVQDIQISTGEKTMKEGEEFPVGVGPSGLTSTVADGSFPQVKGFVETLPKKGSELELITKKEDRAFPILASWHYGLGKVIAYTSDANGRWSQPWVRWSGFSRFWTQMIEGVKDKGGQKSSDIDFDIRYRVQGKTLVFDLSIFDEKLRTQLPPKILGDVEEPGGEKRQILFRSVKKGRFEAKVEPARPGDYRLHVNYGAVKLPPVAVTLEGELFGESPGKGINGSLLEDLAYETGGHLNPKIEDVLRERRISRERISLFPPFLLLAALLLLLEAFVRERGWLRRSVKAPEPKKKPVREQGQYGPKKRAA